MPALRFGDLQQEATCRQIQVRFADVLDLRKPLRLRPTDVYRLVAPYLGVRTLEQVRSVIPLALYLVLFQLFVLNQSISGTATLALGFTAVIAGLMLFMEGLKLGLMPLGEAIGTYLPRKRSLPVVLIVAFALGVGVTFAEPAVGALQAAGSAVDRNIAGVLYAALQDYSFLLVLVIGGGVGVAAVIGTLRCICGWSLKPLIYISLIPTLILTAYCAQDASLRHIIGLAWDSGGITTGPVTVPLILALGIGVAGAVGKGESSFSGFGIVTLASIIPVTGVLLLGIGLAATGSAPPQSGVDATQSIPALRSWHETTPVSEILMSMRAIIPLVIFLLVVLFFLLRERIAEPGIVIYGLCVALGGMVLFNIGLTYGLSRLGNQTGSLVPGTFASIPTVSGSPLYGVTAGVAVALLFAFILGFAATMAEPALNALGITVENLTNGTFKKSHLLYSVSGGVGAGIALGISKVIFGLPLAPILIGGYFLAMVMTAFSSEEFVNVAWDSAGVTTGPVTVPLVLALGLSFGGTVGAIEGFGILAGASLCPILAVLGLGLYLQSAEKARKAREVRTLELQKENAL